MRLQAGATVSPQQLARYYYTLRVIGSAQRERVGGEPNVPANSKRLRRDMGVFPFAGCERCSK